MSNDNLLSAIMKLFMTLKSKQKNGSSLSNLLNTIHTQAGAANFDAIPKGWKVQWLKFLGKELPNEKFSKIFVDGTANDLKNFTSTGEGAKWFKNVNKLGAAKANEKAVNSAFAKSAAKAASTIAAAITAYYLADEALEHARDIPGIGYVVKEAQLGPLMLQSYVDGLFPELGKVVNSFKRWTFDWWSNVLDWIGLDNSSQILKDYNQWYDNNNIKDYGITISKLKELSKQWNSEKRSNAEEWARTGKPAADKFISTLTSDTIPDSLLEKLKLEGVQDPQNINVHRFGPEADKIEKVVTQWISELH